MNQTIHTATENITNKPTKYEALWHFSSVKANRGAISFFLKVIMCNFPVLEIEILFIIFAQKFVKMPNKLSVQLIRKLYLKIKQFSNELFNLFILHLLNAVRYNLKYLIDLYRMLQLIKKECLFLIGN